MEGKQLSSIAVDREEVLLGLDTKCPKCKIDFEYIKSIANSDYYYCSKCEYNKIVVKKHMVFDEILKSIQNYFTEIINRRIEYLKIDLLKKEDSICLKVNNEEIKKIKMYTDFTNKDIKGLINTIEYLIDDYFGEGTLKSNISIVI